MRIEAGIRQAVIRELSDMGHVNLQVLPDRGKIGDANSILKERNTITATSDARNDGGAAGF